MPIMNYTGANLPPGQLPSIDSVEHDLTSIIWNGTQHHLLGGHSLVSGASRDAGNTGFTDVLRPGLILTKDVVSGDGSKFLEWGSDTDFATDLIEGILLLPMKIQRDGANQDRWNGYILLGGPIKAQGLIIPGETDSGIVGHAQETNIRTQLKFACQFDDDPFCHLATDS